MARGDRRAPLDGHVAPQPHRRVQSVLSGLDGREPIENLPRGSPPGPLRAARDANVCPPLLPITTAGSHLPRAYQPDVGLHDDGVQRCSLLQVRGESWPLSVCLCPFLILLSCCTPCRKHWADYLNSTFCSDRANPAPTAPTRAATANYCRSGQAAAHSRSGRDAQASTHLSLSPLCRGSINGCVNRNGRSVGTPQTW